ncbi:hypothetical protein Dsin_032666 [Dipteronia sinensis]|uniref:Uncharacterized protein n=1 Tax=Dipteronia sinensis TaxID=43782 RepID=A0AAD9Z986_9ROSI|nr:hypothetical protein Dsin_032666 [Dipteronia sinensis]
MPHHLVGYSVNDPMNAKLLKAVYSAEDATDSFLMSKEIHHIEKSREQDQRKKKKASYPIRFTEKIEKFNDEIRLLKGAENLDIENNNNTRLLRFQNDRQRQNLDMETHVVGLQHQINDLVVRLIQVLDIQENRVDQVIATVGISFSSSHESSKIIIIVRSTVYLPRKGYSTLNICKLNNEESWKLFSNKVRIAEQELNNSELITIKEQILKICCGLPSTIVLLGGLLSTKEKNL